MTHNIQNIGVWADLEKKLETVKVPCPTPHCGMVWSLPVNGGWFKCPVCGGRLHPSMAEKAEEK